MDDSVSVTTSCLAVADKRTRKTGGCVGIFFQLFDWNRRFSKKKLFSKRLLPPDRSKESSKLLQIDYENSGSIPINNNNGDSGGNNGGQTPSLVARLMGLESMPLGEFNSENRQKLTGEINDPNNKPTRQNLRPQKLQKTGISDRRSVTKFGSEALQLRNVLSRSRKHHHPKLASPVPKTNYNQSKKNSSRLIGAATRVLESGLQNKSKRAITYGARNRVKGKNLDSLNQQTSCENCGNLINVSESKLNIINQRVDDDRVDFVGLNKRVTGQTRSRVRGKFENGPGQWRKSRITGNGPHNGIRTVNNLQSTSKQRGLEGRLERRKNYQNAISCNPNSQKVGLKSPIGLTGDCLGALVEEKLQELASRVGFDSRINGNQTKRTASVLRGLSVERQINRNTSEFGPKRNGVSHLSGCEYDHKTGFCFQTKLQKAVGLIGRKNRDHLSPGSVLESPFSNESCCSSSLEDNSGPTAPHVRSVTYKDSQFQEYEANPFFSDVLFRKDNTRNVLVLELLTYISQVLSTIDIVHSRITGHTRAHIKRVIFNSELVLANQTPHNRNELNSFFICDLLLNLDALADIIRTTFGNFLGLYNAVARNQLKRFVFDAVIEYLESKYEKYSKCGFRAWINLGLFRGFDGFVHEVVEEVRGWMCDDLVEWDMRHCLGEWIDFEVEVYETGAKIESDIMQMLVDEIVVDV